MDYKTKYLKYKNKYFLLKNQYGGNYKTNENTLNSKHCLEDTNGEFEKDVKAKKLTSLLFDAGIKTKSTDIANDLWTNDDGTIDGENFRIFNPNANEIIMMQTDNTVFRNELACLTSV